MGFLIPFLTGLTVGCLWALIAYACGYSIGWDARQKRVACLSANLAAAIKERDGIRESFKRLDSHQDEMLNDLVSFGDDQFRLHQLVGDIAELIERYDAECCGEGEGQ